ncbi:amidohydrolase 2 [Colletotrichum truncatum]|uniref:Amidohydrolase 2 n=1 Tax=Colletotrichum truncatum TaxID=5467 RepID=A0ACC3YJY6_COLTU|nr:amidohydrolase 2 [Colletotrichum truncatum]KAF6797455.1 amidohydrolase 2 [Colletotrichum truncatum]
MSDLIDTHIHVLPPAYVDAIEAAGGDPSGFPSPEWSFGATLESINATGTSVAILSVSAPGVSIAGTGEVALKLTRDLNQYLAEQTRRTEAKQRLGFFGVLPDWQDVEGTIAELEFLYQHQKLCFGVTVFTSYGGKLLGDRQFQPIWERLQSYKALVFIHPTSLEVEPRHIASNLPQPIVDYPLATTRTAVDLVLTGTLSKCPDVDVILSHAGGTLPFIANRIMGSLQSHSVKKMMSIDFGTAKETFSRFYYDIALSCSSAQLNGLLDFAAPSHILFGSDFPYCPPSVIGKQVQLYSAFVTTEPRGRVITPHIVRQNSRRLLTKHQQNQQIDWDFKVHLDRRAVSKI